MTEFSCVLDAKANLGESTYWDPALQCLWWIDIYSKEIHQFNPSTGNDRVWATPEMPGSIAPSASGGLVLAMGDGFYEFDLADEGFQPIVMVEADIPDARMNDGRTDRQGRFWAGSMFEAEGKPQRPIAALYRLDHDRTCHKMIDGIGCSNGLAWSPDGRTMYHADSHTPFIWAWDYDTATGAIENKSVFVDLSSIDAIADGATVDENGCYWVTLPFKGQVHCYDPAGKLVRSIATPTDIPTCCEFGGEGLDTLYVTTAILKRPPEQLSNQPLAGALLAIDVGVKGLAASPWRQD